ncbi:MAG: hypothetical protein BWY69_00228 [Planctomycetes bacterium ADurb.Bin401]|nr:MAG: hypothetical protein BWY69_00228 [Planctomycetes bacterium ADurb.Bin401]
MVIAVTADDYINSRPAINQVIAQAAVQIIGSRITPDNIIRCATINCYIPEHNCSIRQNNYIAAVTEGQSLNISNHPDTLTIAQHHDIPVSCSVQCITAAQTVII